MFVLDTNTLIYFFKDQGKVKERLLAVPPSELGLPTIVIYELKVGLSKSNSPQKRRKMLDEFCSIVKILPFGEKEAHATALIRAQCEKKGEVISPLDFLIAGTAISAGATLVTRNLKEFKRVPKLNVVSWFD